MTKQKMLNLAFTTILSLLLPVISFAQGAPPPKGGAVQDDTFGKIFLTVVAIFLAAGIPLAGIYMRNLSRKKKAES